MLRCNYTNRSVYSAASGLEGAVRVDMGHSFLPGLRIVELSVSASSPSLCFPDSAATNRAFGLAHGACGRRYGGVYIYDKFQQAAGIGQVMRGTSCVAGEHAQAHLSPAGLKRLHPPLNKAY